jgi:hypothetical protein
MYKAIIQDTAILSIRNFIKKYLEVFLNIYTDTGIPNVDIIIENYYSSSTELRNEIYKSMIMTFESEVLAKYSSSQ